MSDLTTITPAVEVLGSLARAIKESGFGVQFPVVHRFTPGLYVRELTVPAGMYVITKVHHTEHPYVISKGRIRVWTEAGGVVELAAPYCGITKPGTIRLALTMEETVWTTFHPTTETDIEVLERELASDPTELLADVERLKELHL
jgi:hypothetical protein